jgi:2-polyprenyl-3-methyl-5-hydroxy-6-metoxy-1,4-benzoquinol methylase
VPRPDWRLPDLGTRRPDAVEQMDSPDCDLTALHRTYRGFALVNPVVAGWRLTYRTLVRPLLDPHRTSTLLDLGCGGGDLARTMVRWAAADGLPVRVTAVDPDARAHAWASARPAVAGLDFRRAHSADLVAAGERYDVVFSNHLLHHLDPQALDGVLADSEALAVRRAVHSDIRRSPVAYALFSAGAGLATPLFPRSFIRADGLASIRRSYTPGELAAALRPGWRVSPQAPWRNVALWDGEAVGDAR